MFKELFANTKLTKIEIAKQIGISRQYLRMIEKNDYIPSLKILNKISVFLNIKLNDLIKLVEEKESVVSNCS